MKQVAEATNSAAGDGNVIEFLSFYSIHFIVVQTPNLESLSIVF